MYEITVRSYINIVNGSNTYRSSITGFLTNQTNQGGGSPGYIKLLAGTPQDISLAGFTKPGYVEIENVDPISNNNYATFGIFDNTTGAFYPLGEVQPSVDGVQPGEKTIFRLSRFILEELTGTGTHEGHAVTFRIEPGRGGGSCEVNVRVFES